MINIFINFSYIKKKLDEKSILGESSLTQYLSKTLNCSDIEANYLIIQMPNLKNRSPMKMQEIIELLKANGFTTQHIIHAPKILLHSVKTTKLRLNEIKEANIKLDSLHVLTKSQKQYKKFCENFLTKRKNSQQNLLSHQ